MQESREVQESLEVQGQTEILGLTVGLDEGCFDCTQTPSCAVHNTARGPDVNLIDIVQKSVNSQNRCVNSEISVKLGIKG